MLHEISQNFTKFTLLHFSKYLIGQAGGQKIQIQLLEELTIDLKSISQRSLALNFTNIKVN